MNNAQKQIIGMILCASGALIFAYGGYELYLAFDYNQTLNDADKSLGGIISGVSNLVGASTHQSYVPGGAISLVGALDFILGWVFLGKIKKS
jgi:hypothetical protein